MARINIEECWWTDPRREKLAELVGGPMMADALAIRAWRLAQEFWGDGRQLIPPHVFSTLEANAKLIQANLAEEREDGIYVRGSSQRLEWHAIRREAARVGGLKSAEKKRKKVKQTPSKLNQTQPSHSHSLSHSSSNSNSGILALASQTPQTIVAFYCDRWRERNGKNPDIRPKEAGQLTRLVKDVGLERAKEITLTYFRMPDPFFIKRGYDPGTMLLNLAAIAQFESSGKIVTSEVVKQLEKQVDKIQGTRRRRTIEELEAEREEQKRLASGES